MIRKNFGILIVFTLVILFLYYASYFNNPFSDKTSPDYINYSSDVTGKNGMVVSASKYASRVGIFILNDGGNAIDAAVAVAFTLAVTYPQAGNIGGGGFMLIRTKDSVVTSIDFREKAPSSSSKICISMKKEILFPKKASSVIYHAVYPAR